jgi:hypothetical protein
VLLVFSSPCEHDTQQDNDSMSGFYIEESVEMMNSALSDVGSADPAKGLLCPYRAWPLIP